jgi:CRP-like cAMP-binding protein
VKSHYMRNAPYFSALTEEEQKRVSQKMHLEHRPKGDVLFQPGEESTSLYFVKSGWVQLFSDSSVPLANLGPGSLVGEADLFQERRHLTGAKTTSEAELWVLTRADLTALITDDPQIGLKLTLAFGAHLAQFDRYLVDHRLRPIPFLADLPDEVLEAIARRLAPVVVTQEEQVVEACQPPEALYIIERGRVKLTGCDEDSGGDFVEIGQGETFGEMAVLADKAHAITATSVDDALLWALSAPDFNALTDNYPALRRALSQLLQEPLIPDDQAIAVERLVTMPLFSNLEDEALKAAAKRLLLRHVPAGEVVYPAGSVGDALYMIESGSVELLSEDRDEPNVIVRLGAGEFFGEMALLTGKPRSTTARAMGHTNLWALYKTEFEDLVLRYPSISLSLSRALSQRLAEADRRFADTRLRRFAIFARMSDAQLGDLSQRLKPTRFRKGEVLMAQGQPGDVMYLIESGQVEVVRQEGQRELVLAELGTGELVGEMALLTGDVRSATVRAVSNLDLLSLSADDFDAVLSAYPNLALDLSRLLSERLRNTTKRVTEFRPAPTARAAAPRVKRTPARTDGATIKARRRAKVAPAARAKRAPAAKPETLAASPGQELLQDTEDLITGFASWFGGLQRGTQVRLVVITLLLVWLVGIAAPAAVISGLAEYDVTNLQGAIAWVRTATPPPTATPFPTDTPIPTPVPATYTPTPVPLTDTPIPPTDTPIPPTDTPIPPTDTPIPPTDTPVPPTDTPVSLARSVAPALAAANTPEPSPTPLPPVAPRGWDPRLDLMNIQIEPAPAAPGQKYWRLVDAKWRNEAEAQGAHSIYVEVLDDAGNRMIGQRVEIGWGGGSQVVITEDKPAPEYASNFPMYNTLGSYWVRMADGQPSERVVGLGLGTPDQPRFTIHTVFLLTFRLTQN